MRRRFALACCRPVADVPCPAAVGDGTHHRSFRMIGVVIVAEPQIIPRRIIRRQLVRRRRVVEMFVVLRHLQIDRFAVGSFAPVHARRQPIDLLRPRPALFGQHRDLARSSRQRRIGLGREGLKRLNQSRMFIRIDNDALPRRRHVIVQPSHLRVDSRRDRFVAALPRDPLRIQSRTQSVDLRQQLRNADIQRHVHLRLRLRDPRLHIGVDASEFRHRAAGGYHGPPRRHRQRPSRFEHQLASGHRHRIDAAHHDIGHRYLAGSGISARSPRMIHFARSPFSQITA